jgi:hypothetical protein
MLRNVFRWQTCGTLGHDADVINARQLAVIVVAALGVSGLANAADSPPTMPRPDRSPALPNLPVRTVPWPLMKTSLERPTIAVAPAKNCFKIASAYDRAWCNYRRRNFELAITLMADQLGDPNAAVAVAARVDFATMAAFNGEPTWLLEHWDTWAGKDPMVADYLVANLISIARLTDAQLIDQEIASRPITPRDSAELKLIREQQCERNGRKLQYLNADSKDFDSNFRTGMLCKNTQTVLCAITLSAPAPAVMRASAWIDSQRRACAWAMNDSADMGARINLLIGYRGWDEQPNNYYEWENLTINATASLDLDVAAEPMLLAALHNYFVTLPCRYLNLQLRGQQVLDAYAAYLQRKHRSLPAFMVSLPSLTNASCVEVRSRVLSSLGGWW